MRPPSPPPSPRERHSSMDMSDSTIQSSPRLAYPDPISPERPISYPGNSTEQSYGIPSQTPSSIPHDNQASIPVMPNTTNSSPMSSLPLPQELLPSAQGPAAPAKLSQPPTNDEALTTPTQQTSALPSASERGLAFLEQYMQAFDNDRDALVDAYTPNATLSFTEDDSLSTVGHQHRNMTNIGPDAIVKTLKTIETDVHHSSAITYTITALDDMNVGGLLLTCQGSLLPNYRAPDQERRLVFNRIFVLMQNQGASSNTWLLQIVSDTLNLTRQRR
ncbi:hypothetical protein M422DRAFT_34100 [Sphaerobolus stellatus SS14]|uniref:NTF2 domain-containing protein n=1 Tax=Sphaerobolus stellatus (strain SS14) TaxID=990650 RepID=A0A0C9VH97_SPHS4|nr:hypothetical protein M422DRAFT_34100 [Sphaerobolus stellatus SS14]